MNKETEDGKEIIELAIKARDEAKLKVKAKSLIQEVEGFEEFRNSAGVRLKDTLAWCEFYSAVKKFI